MDRTWHAAAKSVVPDALLRISLPVNWLCVHLQHWPSEARVTRLMYMSRDDNIFLRTSTLEEVFRFQLLFQHVHARILQRSFRLCDVLDVLLKAVDPRLSIDHGFVRRATILPPQEVLNTDIRQVVPYIGRAWRQTVVEDLHIASLICIIQQAWLKHHLLSHLFLH